MRYSITLSRPINRKGSMYIDESRWHITRRDDRWFVTRESRHSLFTTQTGDASFETALEAFEWIDNQLTR